MLYLISILSFLLPFQLAIHFNNFQNTVYGFKIDYLIPSLYITDIVAILVIALGLRKFKFNRKYIVYCIFYIGFVIINLLVSSYLVASVYRWFKITELILLGVVIFNTKKFDVFKHFINPLSYSVFIECLLGIGQFLNKGSIGGVFYYLGERAYLVGSPNIAPYPYATFSHPNAFAGFLLVFGIFLLRYRRKFDTKYFLFLVSLVAINLVLTNSLNVYVTIAILLVISIRSNLSFGFLAFNFNERFITHRIELIGASWKMIKSHFLFGVGLNNFIPNLVRVSNTFVNAWELQPVHNIFLLVFSETGIVGLCVLFYMFYAGLAAYNLPLIAIVVTGLSDHYWLTLQQNMLLFTYVLVIFKRYAK